MPAEPSGSPTKVADIASLKASLLRWGADFPFCMYLDSCHSEWDRYGQYELLMGVAVRPTLIHTYEDFEKHQQEEKWIMGGLPYELKNRFEPNLQPDTPAHIAFPETACFIPETVVYILKGETTLHIEGPLQGWDDTLDQQEPEASYCMNISPEFTSNFTREQYLETVEQLRSHIKEGDFYEINLSQVFTANYTLKKPAQLFQKLIESSPVPFAAFFRFQDKYVLSASPERFLQRKEDRLLTQPIKGTAARSHDPSEDIRLATALLNSAKERAENVMIVDLSRNDLYKSSEPHTVNVPHLFEVQSFNQVHHMVSTITGKKQPGLSNADILANTFPAGSMTGAPKFRVMNMINRYEGMGRGLYAGSLGYFGPTGDFDLNVVIRSLIYDAQSNQLCYQVGGAITYDSDPEAEYEETLLKAKAIRELFE